MPLPWSFIGRFRVSWQWLSLPNSCPETNLESVFLASTTTASSISNTSKPSSVLRVATAAASISASAYLHTTTGESSDTASKLLRSLIV